MLLGDCVGSAEKCTGGYGGNRVKGQDEGIENKWVRDSAIFRWCRVFRLADSALSSALRFYRSSIPSSSPYSSLVRDLVSLSLLPPRGKVPRSSRVRSLSNLGPEAPCLGKPRQRVCAAFNGSPPQTYRTTADLSLGHPFSPFSLCHFVTSQPNPVSFTPGTEHESGLLST